MYSDRLDEEESMRKQEELIQRAEEMSEAIEQGKFDPVAAINFGYKSFGGKSLEQISAEIDQELDKYISQHEIKDLRDAIFPPIMYVYKKECDPKSVQFQLNNK